MAQKKTKLKNKIWSLALCASMILSCLPISAFAETDSGLCEHHHEHTAECGYVASVEGQPCTHEHTDDCYSIVDCVHERDEECGENCTHVCSEDSGCITVKHNCHHIHDENCGYSESTPASDCTHECGEECADGCIHEHDETCGYAEAVDETPCSHICSIEDGCYELVCSHAVEGQHDDTCGYVAAVAGSPCEYVCEEDHGEEETTESTETSASAYTVVQVKAMIDALSDVSELEGMDSDELNAVYTQAQAAVDAYEALTEDEQAELSVEAEKLVALLEYMASWTMITATGTGDYGVSISSTSNTRCWESGCEKTVTVTKIQVKSISLVGTNLYISAILTYSCGHTKDFSSENSRLVVSNFSCTNNYSTTNMKTESGITYGSLKFSRTAGHSVANWSTSNNKHSGSCALCESAISENCSGGTATCQNKAVCSTCGNEYGSTINHNYIRDAKSIGNGQHTAKCETCSAESTVTCSYTNGICSVCGYNQPANQNGEGYYEISNAGQLLWFANRVNAGYTGISGKLMANIDLSGIAWTPIGTSSNAYTGTFDGNGKTISNLSITATSDYQGLFGVISGGTVKNFTLNGKIDITATVNNVGGVAGYAVNSATIENVTSNVTITDSRTDLTNRLAHIGGVVASLQSSTLKNATYNGTITLNVAETVGGVIGIASQYSTVSYCTNNGKVSSVGNSAHVGGVAGDAQTGTVVTYCINYGEVTCGGNDCVGGVVGYANEYVKIDYCGNVGTVTSTYEEGGFVGGILGYINNSSFGSLKNCFNTGTIVSNEGGQKYAGAIVGWFRKNATSMVSNNYYLDTSCDKAASGYSIAATAKTANAFTSGEVAYLLNGKINAGTWKQTLNSDNYPNFTGNPVYGGYICGSGNSDFVYQNDNTYLLDEPHPNHDFNNNGICTYCGAAIDITPNEDGIYEITNLGQLQWFANQVNSSNTAINAKLMADIDVSTIPTFGIGTSEHPYAGTFDGNGHTLTISLRSSVQYLALFPYVDGAIIQNLTVDGIIACSAKYAASIVGSAKGNVTIKNCISSVTIKSTLVGDGTHGGFVGVAESNGTLTIENCGFIGKINGTDTTCCGGFVGWANATTTISNSFVAATFTVSAEGSYTFSRNPSKVKVNNCYYLNAFGTTNDGATKKTATQFASGEVAYLLNSSVDNGTWKQNIGTDTYPNFSGKAVYKASPCEIYVNSENQKMQEHIVENGVCKNCGEIISDYAAAVWNAEQNTYEIYTISQLFWFAAKVNDGEYSINGRLMADLDLTGYDWTPIAYLAMSDSATEGYSGVFDGSGHVIRNITIVTPTSATANGLFGIITTGTVKHLGIDNLFFDNNDYDHRAGGIAGQLMSGGTIENCFVVNSTIKASSRVVGGIVGLCKGTVKNCYTANLSLAGHSNRFGGITGDYVGGSIINCYTDYTALGSTASSVGTTDSQSVAGISTEVFTSGKIAYLLNGSTSEGSLVWYQTCGTGYPAFFGKTVYANAICSGFIYSNTNEAGSTEHSYVNGFCQYCDSYQPAVKNANGYYEISNAGQLYWFAALTNGELDGIAQDASANAILMKDITVNTGVIVNGALASDTSSFRYWTPIGNYSGNGDVMYAGIFNGNGHTISGLYMSVQVANSGFIGRNGTGSVIINLSVTNSYFKSTDNILGVISGYNGGTIEGCAAVNCVITGGQHVGGIAGGNVAGIIKSCVSQNCTITGGQDIGGIVGTNQASGTISECASLDSVITGSKWIGGIFGVISDATVSNCYSNSKITASTAIGCGIGFTQNTSTISNCYFTGSISCSKYNAAITYVNNASGTNVTVKDCYYISGSAAGAAKVDNKKGTLTATNVAAKTADQFASGEVAWLLNGSSSTGVWKQTIGSDAAPNFSGMTVYYAANSNPQYYNSENDKVASVTITWTDMSFSYNRGTWDTDTMTWEGGGWVADEGCGTVSVKNTGNVAVNAQFGVNLTNTSYGISVGFTENGVALTDNKLWIAAGNSKTVTVKLTGKEPSDYMAETTIGQITVTLSTE